jgi:alkaline phosphatase
MYLHPIDSLFRLYNGYISSDSDYLPVLMIDIKEKPTEVINMLAEELGALPSRFNRKVNAHSMMVILSGDRGDPASWAKNPTFIFFDGRPNETYDSATLSRVQMISDDYYNQVDFRNAGELSRIKKVIVQAHLQNKPIRFWGAPDTPRQWKLLRDLGVDVLSTDHVKECRKFLSDKP